MSPESTYGSPRPSSTVFFLDSNSNFLQLYSYRFSSNYNQKNGSFYWSPFINISLFIFIYFHSMFLALSSGGLPRSRISKSQPGSGGGHLPVAISHVAGVRGYAGNEHALHIIRHGCLFLRFHQEGLQV